MTPEDTRVLTKAVEGGYFDDVLSTIVGVSLFDEEALRPLAERATELLGRSVDWNEIDELDAPFWHAVICWDWP